MSWADRDLRSACLVKNGSVLEDTRLLLTRAELLSAVVAYFAGLAGTSSGRDESGTPHIGSTKEPAAGPKAWLRQDLSAGFGILKMDGPDSVGRFGGGAWGRINGADFDGDGLTDIVAGFGSGGGAKGTYSGLYVYRNLSSEGNGLLD